MGSSGSKRGSRFDSLDLDQSFDEPVEKRSTSRKVVKKGKDEDDLTTAEFVRRATKAYEEALAEHLEWLREEEDRLDEDIFDFPKDPERWTAEDLQEHWTVGPLGNGKFGWDPVFATKDDWAIAMNEVKAGRRSPVAPYYLPFYKNDPVIPEEEFDIANPKSLIEELDRIEEFLTWESYVFKDGSSYEGTVWDDMATGKGVFATRNGLVRYEGEWLQNNMEGHGVVEVDIPDIEPRPGSKLEAKMRAEGKIIKRDYMSPADQKWLAMDIEESIWLTRRRRLFRIPFYERSEWIKVFGKKPEKGRYKYAGQWKHGRMHGCGVYEVNTRIIYGRFYFGEYLNDSLGCDADISALHAGIAEVAAAKARMFVNKPDGMVREERGPYGDPQHPYFYEEEDVWMAPGFINQFYETPDYWKTYVEEVDKEREMWLNSFYKSPLRIPMPAELEYWWEKYESPEFLVLNKEPEPDPEDPSKLVYTEDPLILHIPSGKLIDCADDENDGIRLFWKQELNDEDEDEDPDVDKREFLPLGFDEFYGRAKRIVERKEFWLVSFLAWFKKAIKPKLEQLEKWTDEKKKDCEEKLELVDLERELVESEMRYEEEMEEFEADVKDNQKEEEKNTLLVRLDESVFNISGKDDFNEEEEDEEETTSSFGIASTKNSEKESSKDDKEGRQSGTSSFSSLSMSFCTFASVSQVPKKILGSFLPRNQGSGPSATRLASSYPDLFQAGHAANAGSISYPRKLGQSASLRVAKNKCRRPYTHVQNNLARLVSADGTVLKRSNSQNDSWHADRGFWNMSDLERNPLCVLSLHVPLGSPQLRRPNMPL